MFLARTAGLRPRRRTQTDSSRRPWAQQASQPAPPGRRGLVRAGWPELRSLTEPSQRGRARSWREPTRTGRPIPAQFRGRDGTRRRPYCIPITLRRRCRGCGCRGRPGREPAQRRGPVLPASPALRHEVTAQPATTTVAGTLRRRATMRARAVRARTLRPGPMALRGALCPAAVTNHPPVTRLARATAAPGYGPARAYDAGQGLAPAQGRGPGSGYVAGRDYGPGPGHGVVRDYHPGSGYPRPPGRPGNRGDQRLFAVPDGASAAGRQYRAGAGPVAPLPGRHPLGPAGDARGQAGSADSGELWLARRALAAAEDEAAAIRRAAEQEAAATRQAAEQEAADLRAAVMTMSAELGRVAAYVTEYLGRHAVREERPRARPAAVPGQGLAAQDTPARPAGPATGRGRPDARTAPRPAAPPIPRPSDRPGARQAAAMRKMVVVFAALFAVAVTGGLAQLGLHGFSFFAFRAAGTGATDNNGLQENQGPGQPDAPRAHHAKPAAHHSAPKPKAQRSSPA